MSIKQQHSLHQKILKCNIFIFNYGKNPCMNVWKCLRTICCPACPACHANESNYNIYKGSFVNLGSQCPICYSPILPAADERKIKLMEIAATGSPNFFHF